MPQIQNTLPDTKIVEGLYKDISTFNKAKQKASCVDGK